MWNGRSLDQVDAFERWSLVIWWEWVGGDIRLLWRHDHLIVNEILNLMTQSKALAGVMTMLLVKGAVLSWVMGSREFIW